MDRAAEAEFSEFMHGRWLQLVRLGYVLTGDRDQAWTDRAETAARALKIDLDVHRIEAHSFPAAYGVTASGAVLVRPDGFVAWRAKSAEGPSSSALLPRLRAILKV